MKKRHISQFLILLLILFGVLSYKTYEQYKNIEETQKLLILNESTSLATFIGAFRTTYQDAFVNNHIKVTNQTMKLLPVQTISEISSRFSSSLHGDVTIRTVSDRPRNPLNMANNFELEMMDYFRANPAKESDFIYEDGAYYFTKPLYITPLCMKCHGKREDAVPSIREKYSTAYDYKLGELRGILNIKIKDREQFDILYESIQQNVIIAIIMFIVLALLIYILVRKISMMEKKHTEQLEDEVAKKTDEIKQQSIAFEHLFENSFQGISIIKDGIFIDCNIAVVRMLRYSSKKEVLDLIPSQLSPEFQEDGSLSSEKANKMIKITEEKGAHSFEWTHRRSDGNDFWVFVTMTQMSLLEGDIIHVSWIDISKRKELEKEVRLYTKDLETRNKKLDGLIQVEVEKNKKQQQVLFEQSRMAQMGEMISMIAHQWRQPLASISATSIDLDLKMELETFAIDTQEGRTEAMNYFKSSLGNINELVQSLTLTIDDFRNFYKPNKERDTVCVNTPIEKACAIVKASLEANDIESTYEYKARKQLELYSNELMQVVLNILQNAQDTLLTKEISNPQIIIKTLDTKESSIIEISDNGGGIDNEIIGKIFDPYFSTKNEKNGTGLGLYMSKTIVEEHHNGSLSVENIDDGVCFRIELVKKDKNNGNK